MTSKMSLFGTIPEDWNLTKISEVATLKQGLQISKKLRSTVRKKGYIPLLKITDLPNKRFSEFVTDIKESYIAREDDIIYTRTGQVGLVYTEVEGCVHNNCFKIIVDYNKINKDFIFYYLNNSIVRQYSNSIASGSVQKDLTHSSFKTLPIAIPPYKEQVKIGGLLRRLDEKIDTNKKINKKLEELAKGLYKQWFVDFEFPNNNGKPYESCGGEMVESELGMIPKGWKTAKLEDIIGNIKQSAKPGEHLRNRKYLPIDVLPMRSITVTDYKSYKEAKSSLILFDKYDILLGAMRVYFHRVNLAPFQGVTRTTTFVLRPKVKYDLLFSLFLLNQDETISYANQSSKGSTIPYAVWDGGLCKMPIVLPPENLRHKFNEKLFPFINQMITQSEENRKLKKIRDTLLPKLMSGELRVPLEEFQE